MSNKVFKTTGLLVMLSATVFSMTLCQPYDWHHDECNWVCNEPYIELFGKYRLYSDKGQIDVIVDGKMTIKDIDYLFNISSSNDSAEAKFYESFAYDLHTYELLLKSTVKYKDDKLYFTVVEDGGFDLVGKTLVFNKISCI